MVHARRNDSVYVFGDELVESLSLALGVSDAHNVVLSVILA